MGLADRRLHGLGCALLAGLTLACAAPARAAPRPGERAAIGVSVATLWKAPNVHRAIDRPAVANPVDLDAWNRNLATGALRRDLTSRIQTQALYGSYGTWLPSHGNATPDGRLGVVGTPDGDGTIPVAAFRPVPPLSGVAVVREARRFLGIRYLWGGLSSWGFDCSGLVWDVFRSFGRTIPRDADPQFRHGTPVARRRSVPAISSSAARSAPSTTSRSTPATGR